MKHRAFALCAITILTACDQPLANRASLAPSPAAEGVTAATVLGIEHSPDFARAVAAMDGAMPAWRQPGPTTPRRDVGSEAMRGIDVRAYAGVRPADLPVVVRSINASVKAAGGTGRP
jgi:hypothetical protein